MCTIISSVSEGAKLHVAILLSADLDRSKSLEWEDLEKLTNVSFDFAKTLSRLMSDRKRKARRPVCRSQARNSGDENHLGGSDGVRCRWRQVCEFVCFESRVAFSSLQVTKEEWHLMWQSLVDGKPAAADWQGTYADFMFKLLDASGDLTRISFARCKNCR
jgi:hypothetical protein